MSKKQLVNDRVTIMGLICSFLFGFIIGGVVYLLIKMLNLKNILWIIIFIFTPPVIGAIIFLLSRARKV